LQAMKKRTLAALGVAVVLPVLSYLVVSYYSKDAVTMPRRYFFDTVVTALRNGKMVNDTVWHKVKPFALTNQLGKNVSLNDWGNKIIIADFFFTSCPSICPTLTRNMKKLQDAFAKTDTIVRFVSFTVDPQRDSATRLKAYADKYNVNHDTWWFLTGERQEVYDIALNEFKASVAQEEGVDTNFIHTDKFFVLDKDRVVRGWYNGLDSANLDKLMRDVVFLMMEKDRKKNRNLFRK
jgi:protein SCO1/2